MLIVISPAKNLDLTRIPPKGVSATQPIFLSQAAQLIEELKVLAPQDISSLMKLSDKLGALNFERFQQWHTPFNRQNASLAALTFNGDVYQGLGASSFSSEDFAFAQAHLCILSGLYGVLRPCDYMQAYRLEMGTRFANAKGKDLYAFWGDSITEYLNQHLAKQKSEVLINLASNEYFKVVKPKQLNAKIIEPVFKEAKNGSYKIVSFYAKKARGLMSAFCIKNRISEPLALQTFNLEGYQFNTEMSTDTQWVFVR